MLRKRIKATVRRRTLADDAGCLPEEIWPPEFIWVCDEETFYEDGAFASGCVTPFETHQEALDEAIAVADEVRRWNKREEQEDARSEDSGVRDQAAVAADLEAE